APRSSQEATQPAASEPGPNTPPPAKRTKAKQAAEPTQPTKGTGKALGNADKAKPAQQPDQGALPAKGKEYPGLGYKRLRDKPPKAQQQPAVAQCERAVIGSLLLGFLVRGLFTIHVADPLGLHGQPVYTDIPVPQAAIPNLNCATLSCATACPETDLAACALITTHPASSEQACDICSNGWSGNWEHLHCRGAKARYGEGSNGVRDGLLTTVHITDVNLDGPVPRQFCALRNLREFDLDGGQLTGPIPRWLLEPNPDPAANGTLCGSNIQELDLSSNRLSGTIPPELSIKKSMQEFKIEHNHVTGTLPESFGQLPDLWRIRLATNHMTGRMPQSLSNLTATLNELWLDNNDFEGDLYMLGPTKLVWVTGYTCIYQRRGRVVLVDEHRTTRVSSAVNGQQPCEEELDHEQPTRRADWKPPAGQVDLRPAWSQQRDQPVRGMMWCPVVAPRKPPQAPRSSQEATQPAASEPGSTTPLPAKRSKRTTAKQAAEPTQPTKGTGQAQGKSVKAKPAPQPGRWLDMDCNATVNMQRIGESRWRPLELCWPRLQASQGPAAAAACCGTVVPASGP
ncbi:hypothetical protein QJQ45_015442, partial [Haematococcus lacustris]